MIEYSVCAPSQEIIISLAISIFLNKIFLLYSQQDLTTDYIQELRRKNAQNQHFWSFLIEEVITIILRQNLARE